MEGFFVGKFRGGRFSSRDFLPKSKPQGSAESGPDTIALGGGFVASSVARSSRSVGDPRRRARTRRPIQRRQLALIDPLSGLQDYVARARTEHTVPVFLAPGVRIMRTRRRLGGADGRRGGGVGWLGVRACASQADLKQDDRPSVCLLLWGEMRSSAADPIPGNSARASSPNRSPGLR
jgi:hypothetical protein